jgi:hypothetical protein
MATEGVNTNLLTFFIFKEMLTEGIVVMGGSKMKREGKRADGF